MRKSWWASLPMLVVLWAGCGDGADFFSAHKAPIKNLLLERDRLLSVDAHQHYYLWDVRSQSPLRHGDTQSLGALGGNLLLVQPADFEAIDTSDGHLLSTIPAEGALQAGVATDGSYVWTASATQFRVLQPTGAELFRVSGDYSMSQVFAAPGQVRIGNGAKGANLVEYMTVPGGVAPAPAPFQGMFRGWFLDGGRFITVENPDVVRVFTAAGTAEWTLKDPNSTTHAGMGDLFYSGWLYTPVDAESFYRVGGGTVPLAQFIFSKFLTVVRSVNGFGYIETTNKALSLITFPGGMPTHSALPWALADLTNFAVDASGAWAVGDSHGTLFYSGS